MNEEKQKAVEVLMENTNQFILNMSDTFAFACADVEEMSDYDFEVLIPVVAKYGHDALVAYAAVKRGQEPIDCKCAHKNPRYQAAKKEIEDINMKDEYFMDD